MPKPSGNRSATVVGTTTVRSECPRLRMVGFMRHQLMTHEVLRAACLEETVEAGFMAAKSLCTPKNIRLLTRTGSR